MQLVDSGKADSFSDLGSLFYFVLFGLVLFDDGGFSHDGAYPLGVDEVAEEDHKEHLEEGGSTTDGTHDVGDGDKVDVLQDKVLGQVEVAGSGLVLLTNVTWTHLVIIDVDETIVLVMKHVSKCFVLLPYGRLLLK
jgi:hypothetical protein